MNKSKAMKLAIAIVIIIIIILIIVIGLWKLKGKEEVVYEYDENVENSSQEYTIDRTLKDVTEVNEYFIVKNIVYKYYSTCQAINSDSEATAEKVVYNMLDTTYFEEFDITQEDIKQKFEINSEIQIMIENMYVLQNSDNVSTYFVTGVLVNTESAKISKINISISVDILNKTFSIYPQEYFEKYNYGNLTVGDTLEIDIESIENREDNTYKYELIQDEDICQEYLLNYKYNMLYNAEYAYELIDEEYKEKRFPSLSDFQSYIQENRQKIQNTTLVEYLVEQKDKYKQYTCLDNYGNYYIFNATAAMKYTVLLDNYTVETEEFKSTYNGLDESNKIATNIDKFIKCINNKDYNQAYSFLDEEFKNNYFKDISSFKEYVENNFYDYNVVGKIDINNEGSTFICTVPIKSGVGTGAKSTKKTIIMQLGEGMDFVMSFSIE